MRGPDILKKALLAAFGVAAVASSIAIAARGSHAENADDPRIIATLTFSEGFNIDDSLCSYYKRIERMEIHADGRVMELGSTRGTVCREEGRMERGTVGTPHWSRIPATSLDALLTRLRALKDEALKRRLQMGRMSTEDSAWRELSESMTISVADDRQGALSSDLLPRVQDLSQGAALAGRSIRSEIRAQMRND